MYTSTFSYGRKGLWVLTLLTIFHFYAVNVTAQSGLNSAQAVGKFLNGSLPALTPGDGGNISWSVEPAFPNLRFQDPLVITPHPNEDRLFVASRQGLIEHFVHDPNVSTKQVFLDLRNDVGVIWDGGFLGFVFHPEFGQPGSPNRNYFYVYFTAKGPNGENGPFSCSSTCFSCPNNANFFGAYLRLSRFEVNEGTLTVNPNSELRMINIRAFNGTHRGGGLTFGDDGFLYLTIGDQARYLLAQNIVDNFEGGVIRIDVDQKGGNISHAPRRKMGVHTGQSDEYTGVGYYVPNSNPFLDSNNGLFEEFVSLGHRAPHRMTKDRATGEMWIGEVGGGSREEISILQIGGNGGWPIYEGNNFRNVGSCGSNNLAMGLGTYNPPVVDFQRNEANAIIGGYVYRGSKFPSLYGKYICGGYSQNRMFVIEPNGSKSVLTSFTPGGLITFGEDGDGELFMGRQNGNTTLYTLKATGGNPPAPQLLSQIDAFKNLNTLEPEDGVIPYDMIEDFWSDGAEKDRWMAIPNDGSHNTAAEKIQFSEEGNWILPRGAVLIKHFELGGQRLETRFEVKGDDDRYYYLTYKWNAAGTDAQLLTGSLDETVTVNGQSQVWHYPSQSECLNCHQQGAGSILGPKTRYLNRSITYPRTGITANQLVTLSSIGILDQSISNSQAANFPTMAAYDDPNASLELRARSYLDLNCSYCHQPAVPNRAQFDARLTTPLAEQNLIYGPIITPLNLSEPWTIVPQNTSRSMIHHRMNSTASGVSMPPLAKNEIDQPGVQLIADWINSLPPSSPPTALGQGSGLSADYFNNINFTNLTLQRIDPTINFNWGGGSPDPSIGADTYSARWEGYIEAPSSGVYTFYTNTDDGVRLWVDNQLIINNWTDHAPTEDVAELGMGIGQLVPIKLEWYENRGGAVMQMSWSGPGISKQIIPQAYLYPDDFVLPISVTVTPTDASTCGGLGSVAISYNRGTLEVRNSSNQVVSDLNNLPGGTYTWTVTDGNDQENGSFTLSRAFELPSVTGTTGTDISQCGVNDGRISFTLDDNPNRTNIEFSIDGGASYPLNVQLTAGSASFENLAPGSYSVWARWGNDDCPIDLGTISLNSPTPPVVSIDPAGPFEDNAGIQTLSGNPAGGTWGGAAASNGTFDPSVGVGTYQVTYTYTDGNNCSGTATRQIQVIQGSDTESPSVPQNLVASNITENAVTLSWNPSSDNVGVVAYLIYQNGNGNPIQMQPGTSYTVTGLTSNTTYLFAVAASDAAGNVSGQSQAVQVQTLGGGGTCTTPTNLATSGTASQSSTYGSGAAALAIDGNTSASSPWTADLQHTQNENQPWWQVELGQLSELEKVRIFNRTDSNQDRLVDFYVLFSSAPFSPTASLSELLANSSVNQVFYPGIAGSVVEFDISESARYVRIQLSQGGILHMAEVELLGCPSDNDPCEGAQPVSIVPAGPFAENAGIQTLSASPSGGTWGGAAASNGTFNPSVGPGTYTVTYTYTDGNACTQTASEIITVSPVGTCSNAINLSANGSAVQSSTYGNGSASLAIDGNTSGSSPWVADLQHTTNEAQPWWEVDLGSYSQIDLVKIFNRSDCCQERLANFYVFVSSASMASISDLNTVLNSSGVESFYVSGQIGAQGEIPIDTEGRFVRIQKLDPGILHMAEVEVMGCNSGNDPCAGAQPVTISPAGPFAEDAGVQTLTGSPVGGTWGGSAEPNGTFDPSVGPGTYTVSYTFTNGNGCTQSASSSITVIPSGSSCTSPVNLALNQAAEQSSLYGLGVSSLGVDGDIDGTRGPWSNASVVHTARQDQPWWQVSLQDLSEIQEVVIYNRTDCCQSRLTNFYVLISDTPFPTSASLDQLLANSAIQSFFFAGNAGNTERIPVNSSGQYVRVQLSSAAEILHFAELEVMGCTSNSSRLALAGDTEKPVEWSMEVYPNPVDRKLFIELLPDEENDSWKVEVFDLTGRIVEEFSGRSGVNTWNVSKLSKGIYTLRVQGKTSSKVKRIMVN